MIVFTFVSGLPKPVIRWLRNGVELTGNEPGVSILDDGTLLILAAVSPLDDGEYVCTAANDAGSTEKKYQLRVNGDLAVHWVKRHWVQTVANHPEQQYIPMNIYSIY